MNIREQVRQRLAAVKKTETAAVETAAMIELKTKPLPTSVMSLVVKGLKEEGQYVITKKAVDKGSYVLTVSQKVRRGVAPEDAKSAMAAEVNRVIRTANKQSKKDGEKPKGKPASKPGATMKQKVAATKTAGKRIAKTGTTAKAPKGTGKLKAFMKENGLDLKTLKALVKHITPSK